MNPAWRSILFVPTNVDRFVDKAHTRGADALLLDLEDAIAPADKESARKALDGAIARLARGRSDIGVRINRPLDLAVRDIEAAVQPRVAFLAITKVAGAQHIRLLSELVGELEQRRGLPLGGIRFFANVETAGAFHAMPEIARAERVAALGIGGEDFALSLGIEPSVEAMTMPKQHVVIAARAAGIIPLGLVGSIANFSDLEAYRSVVRRSRALGFEGASAIHPDQVRILNEEFTPAEAEVARARALLAAARAATQGAFAFEGRMVDKPIIERAALLIRRADAIAARKS